MLSEPIHEAAPVGGIAAPDEPELVPELPLVPLLEPLPEGMLEPDGGVDGMVDGLVDGEVEGGLIGAGATVSSTFLPQAPRANNAESANAVTAGLKGTEFMRGFLLKWDGKNIYQDPNLLKLSAFTDETQA